MPIAAHLAPHTAQTTWQSPWGAMLIARSKKGLTGAWFEGQKDHPGRLAAPAISSDALLEECVGMLNEYASGQSHRFDLPLDLHGSEFQLSVWREILEIGWGQTKSYGEIAQRLGSPSASRAVGTAVGCNPVSIIVPCHRVLGSEGSLTGYSGGLHRKICLLETEGWQITSNRVHASTDSQSQLFAR